MTGSKNRPRDGDGYFEIARTLPRPTIEQTFHFAWFVAGAHSWYKHLPADRKVRFVFFLDPNAGKNLVNTQTGEQAMVEVTDESSRFHYTWQTTETYRRRFGHWNYFANYGSSSLFASDSGTETTERGGPSILDVNGNWFRIPTAVLAVGTAEINAFVHPHPWPQLFKNQDVVRQALSGRADETRQHLEKQLRLVSDRPRSAVEDHLRETLGRSSDVRLWSWNDFGWLNEDWEPHLRSIGATDGDIEAAFALFQWRLLEETTCSSDRRGDLSDLGVLFALERHRQMTDMWRAMRRFGAIAVRMSNRGWK
jgi:hypothetical protein